MQGACPIRPVLRAFHPSSARLWPSRGSARQLVALANQISKLGNRPPAR
jgi:hypothetical protein